LNQWPLPCQQGTPGHVQPACAGLRRSASPGWLRWPLLNAPASGLPLPSRSQNRTPRLGTDLALFRSRDHRPGTAMQVSAPAQRLSVPCDVPTCTRVNETQTETLRVATLAAAAARPPGQGRPHRTRFGTRAGWPARFPTMLPEVHDWPLPSATCADAPRVAVGERFRTGVNETRTETRRWAAPDGGEHCWAGAR